MIKNFLKHLPSAPRGTVANMRFLFDPGSVVFRKVFDDPVSQLSEVSPRKNLSHP